VTYLPLPRKYRPQTWDDLVGQAHAVEVLKASILADRIFSAYIFKGTAGSGKTSAARIFAMALNCEALTDGSPCLKCTSCTSTIAFKNTDVVEIDGASHGSVSHMRELKEQALYSPLYQRRVFIIDEVHALSRDAFEALLKLLEEPPSHVLFILATTNPERIPATIQSRSISLDFRRHTEDDVIGRLLHIAGLEGIDLDQGAALLVARFADGSLRDSVTVLDQISTAHPGAPIDPSLVATSLGIVSGTELRSIMDAVLTHDAMSLEVAIQTTLERTTEFSILTRAITDWYRDVLRTKAGAVNAVRRSESDVKLLQQFAKQLDYDAIDNAIRISWELAERVKFSSSNPKTFFLTGLYRLMLLGSPEVSTTVSHQGPPEAVKELTPQPQDSLPAVDFSSGDNSATVDLEEQLRQLAARQ
jgi:DNA polymerase-3 subunit gamma/tau